MPGKKKKTRMDIFPVSSSSFKGKAKKVRNQVFRSNGELYSPVQQTPSQKRSMNKSKQNKGGGRSGFFV